MSISNNHSIYHAPDKIKLADGSATRPSLNFEKHLASGIFYDDENNAVAVSVSGTRRLQVMDGTTDVLGVLSSSSLSTGAITASSGTLSGELKVNSLTSTGVVSGSNLSSGTYTPTVTLITGMNYSTPSVFQYMKIGNIVNVSGRFDVAPLTGTTNCEFKFTLPVAPTTTFATGNRICGTCTGVVSAQINDSIIRSYYTNGTEGWVILTKQSAYIGGDFISVSFQYSLI